MVYMNVLAQLIQSNTVFQVTPCCSETLTALHSYNVNAKNMFGMLLLPVRNV